MKAWIADSLVSASKNGWSPFSKVRQHDDPDGQHQQEQQVDQRDGPQRRTVARPAPCGRGLGTAGPPSLQRRPASTRATSATTSSTVDTAAAAVTLSLSIWPRMYTDATSVWNGRLPVSSTVAPNSLIARVNASAVPASIAGSRLGQQHPAERGEPARAQRVRRLLHLRVQLEQHRLDRADDERQRHEQQRHARRSTRV